MYTDQADVSDLRIRTTIESIVNFNSISTLVDIGCGVGIHSRWLAFKLQNIGKVIGFDIDSSVINQAIKTSQIMNVSNILFESGDVYDIPLPDNYSDFVTCKNLFTVLNNAPKAINEMTRILKPNGHIMLIEPASPFQLIYDPDDQIYTDISLKLNRAFDEAWKKKSADQGIGLKLPGLCLNSGLINITVETITNAHLISDYKRDKNDVLTQLKTESSTFSDSTINMLLDAGLSRQDIDAFQKRSSKRFSSFSKNNSSISKSGYIRIMPTLLIILAQKSDS